MHVIHVIPSLDARSGGPATGLVGQAEAQVNVGLNVTIICTYAEGEDLSLVARLRQNGVNVITVGPAIKKLGYWHPGIRRALNENLKKADVLHVHGVWEAIQHLAMNKAHKTGLPYIVTPHGMIAEWSLRQKEWKKKLYLLLRLRRDLNRATVIRYTSNSERESARVLRFRPPAMVERLGVGLADFHELPPKGGFIAKYPDLAGKKILLFMSRIHHKKGLDLLIPAFARISNDQMTLIIAGPDNDGYEAVVRNMVKQNGIEHRVKFVGMLKGAARIDAFRDADLFVLSSYQENFGIVVLESLACCTPVVITDQVDFGEYMSGENVGEVVPCKIDALQDALQRWLTDDEMRARASMNARPFALREFDWNTIATRWKQHYIHAIELSNQGSGLLLGVGRDI